MQHRLRRLGVALVLSIAVLVVTAAPASAWIYVARWNANAIGRVSSDGAVVNQQFVWPGDTPVFGYKGVAATTDHVYFSTYNFNGISRVTSAGAGYSPFTGGLNRPSGLATDGTWLYWADTDNNRIGRGRLDGTQFDYDFITAGVSGPTGVAVDGTYVYWGQGGNVGRATKSDGSGINTAFVTGSSGVEGVAVNATHVYWAGDGAIGRASIDGTGVNQSFVAAANATGLGLSGKYLYWSGGSTVGRALASDGSGAATFATLSASMYLATVPVAPVASTTGTPLAYAEGQGAVAVDPGLTASDPDATTLHGATVQIVTNLSSAQDALQFTNQNGITGSYDAGTGTLTLTGTAPTAHYEAALRSVRYANSSGSPSTATRTVRFTVTDVEGFTAQADRDVTVRTVTAPVLAGGGGTLAYTEDDGLVAVAPALTVADVDSANLVSATVTITGTQYEDWLNFTAQNGISGSFDWATRTLTLTGAASVAHYQEALRTVRFDNFSNTPVEGGRTVTFTVNDGDGDSNSVTRTIDVTATNDAPVVNATDAALVYSTLGGPGVVDADVAVTDVDSTTLVSAKVWITDSFLNWQDSLRYTDQDGITGSWNQTTGVLTLTGTATVAQYQAALRSVKYENTLPTGWTGERHVNFQVNDGGLDSNSDFREMDVFVIVPNVAPVVGSTSGEVSLAYTGGDPASPVDPNITVTDANSATLKAAAVVLSEGIALGQDELVFTDQNGIAGAWSPDGTLLLTGTATVAQYQAALASVRFRTNVPTPQAGTRTVTFQVLDDQNAMSGTLVRKITVAQRVDPPTGTPPTQDPSNPTPDPSKPTPDTPKPPQAPACPRGTSASVTCTLLPGGGLRMVGTGANEVFVGTAKGDVITGAGGNDTVRAGAGTDVVNGGAGNDVLNGGAGVDRLTGGPGVDTITSNLDSRTPDTIDCGTQRDVVVADTKDAVRASCEQVTRRSR